MGEAEGTGDSHSYITLHSLLELTLLHVYTLMATALHSAVYDSPSDVRLVYRLAWVTNGGQDPRHPTPTRARVAKGR